MQSEIVNHNRIYEECEQAIFIKNQLEEKYDRLKQSQLDYEKKWEKIQHYLTFYRDFYYKNLFPKYKNKESINNFDQEFPTNDILGIETVQNRLNKKNYEKPSILADISLHMLENDFFINESGKIVEIYENLRNNRKDTYRSKSICSVSEIIPLDSSHINKLPYEKFNKFMKKVNNEKKINLKRRISKSKICDFSIIPHKNFTNSEAKLKKKSISNENSFDYGKNLISMSKKNLFPHYPNLSIKKKTFILVQ